MKDYVSKKHKSIARQKITLFERLVWVTVFVAAIFLVAVELARAQ